jgi:hypothetical protein
MNGAHWRISSSGLYRRRCSSSNVFIDAEVEPRTDMNNSFEGKVALVTGAGSGMGLATAEAFAAPGAAVMLADFKEASLLQAA